MKAVLFGSIGTMVESSELQRIAFNSAFKEVGLDWVWDIKTYQSLLSQSGGKRRILTFAEARGEDVDAEAVHARKTELFQEWLSSRGATLRPGVLDVLLDAKNRGHAIAFVTTTERVTAELVANAALIDGKSPFRLITNRDFGYADKPAPEIYEFVLRQLGVEASGAVAIEDNKDGVAASKAAGVKTIGFAGANTPEGDMQNADFVAQSSLLTTVNACLDPKSDEVEA